MSGADNAGHSKGKQNVYGVGDTKPAESESHTEEERALLEEMRKGYHKPLLQVANDDDLLDDEEESRPDGNANESVARGEGSGGRPLTQDQASDTIDKSLSRVPKRSEGGEEPVKVRGRGTSKFGNNKDFAVIEDRGSSDKGKHSKKRGRGKR